MVTTFSLQCVKFFATKCILVNIRIDEMGGGKSRISAELVLIDYGSTEFTTESAEIAEIFQW